MKPPEATVTPAALERCRAFLKALGQTVKLVALYSVGHPVPASAQQETWHLIHDLLVETGWPEARFSLAGGRWLANDAVVADSAQAYELLAVAFRAHGVQTLVVTSECKLYELSAFCELASTPPNRAYRSDAGEFLKERGVRHVRLEVEEFIRARRVNPVASTAVQGAQAAAAAVPAAPPPAQPTGVGFGAFIKRLVERSIADPAERAEIYAEAVRHVEAALARHVSEATHKLLLERQGIVNERVRVEHVLSALAEGKIVVDQEGRVLMMDPAAEEILGHSFSDVAGKSLFAGLEGPDRFVALAKDLVLPENRPVSDEVRTAGGAEALGAFRGSLAVVHDEQGRVVGSYALLPHAAKFHEARRLREEFIANVTHDLKAPLASISSALEVLAGRLGHKLDGEDHEFLEICLRNTASLRQMIDELLDFSKLKSGRMTIFPDRAEVGPLLEDCVRALRPWARSKKIRLEIEAGADALPAALADRGRVLQVLHNLVSNALKFTPEGGAVTLSAARTASDQPEIVVRVADTGCGIEKKDQDRIFERYAQGAGLRGGAGLGLAIAKELVERQRGRIWLESEPGRGAAFSFTLPVDRRSPRSKGSPPAKERRAKRKAA